MAITEKTLTGKPKCKCGHNWDDHVHGQLRPRDFCEYPGCTCEKFEVADG